MLFIITLLYKKVFRPCIAWIIAGLFIGIATLNANHASSSNEKVSEAIPQYSIEEALQIYDRQFKSNKKAFIQARRRELLQATPLDSLIRDFLVDGFYGTYDTISLFSVFEYNDSHLTIEQQRELLPEVYAAADRYKSKELKYAADFFHGRLINGEDYEEQMAVFERLAQSARKSGHYDWEAYALTEAWWWSYYGEQYARCFTYAERLAECLERVDDDFPLKTQAYVWLGVGYYTFKEYEKSYYYLHKGLSLIKPQHVLWAGNILRGWRHLASYHTIQCNLDSASYYNWKIILSNEGEADYPVHINLAFCDLGYIEIEKGNVDAGIRMLETALEHMDHNGADLEYISGIHATLGEYYLEKGELDAVRYHISKGREAIAGFYEINTYQRMKALYVLESDYNYKTGNQQLGRIYLDSAMYAADRYAELSGRHFVLLGEQELQQATIRLDRERIARQRNIITLAIIILALVAAGSAVITVLYRKRTIAYRALAEKARQWAQSHSTMASANPESSTSTGNQPPITESQYNEYATLLKNYILEHKPYTEPELSLDSLAQRMNLTRNTLSAVINRTTGMSFRLYMNELRVMEAIELMNTYRPSELSMDQLMERAGFNGRTTFFNSFKKINALTPSQYWKNNQPQ